MGTSPRSYASALRLKSCGPQAETTKQQHGAGAPPSPRLPRKRALDFESKDPSWVQGPPLIVHVAWDKSLTPVSPGYPKSMRKKKNLPGNS